MSLRFCRHDHLGKTEALADASTGFICCNSPRDLKGGFLQLVVRNELKNPQLKHYTVLGRSSKIMCCSCTTQFWIKLAPSATRLFAFPFYALSTEGSRGGSSQGFSTSHPAIQVLDDVGDWCCWLLSSIKRQQREMRV